MSYALLVIIVTLYVPKTAATDWLGLSATSVNAGLVLITCGVMKALELEADCTGYANVVKSRWTRVHTIVPQTVSIPRLKSVMLRYHKARE